MLVFRYITKELLKAVILIMVFLLVMLISNQFINVLGKAISGRLSSEILFTALMYYIPQMISILLPISLGLGVLVTFSRMSQNHEIDVLYTCGISQQQLIKIISLFAIGIVLINGFLTLWLAPKSFYKQQELIHNYSSSLGSALLTAGQFHELPINGQKAVVYIEEIKRDKSLGRLFLASGGGSHAKTSMDVLTANSGLMSAESGIGQLAILLEDGTRYELDTKTPKVLKTDFEKLLIRSVESSEYKRVKTRSYATVELMEADGAKEQAELFWRLSVMCMAVVIGLLAMPVCRAGQRKERNGRILLSILMIVTYITMILASKSWIENEAIHWLVAFALVHSLFLVLGLLLTVEPMFWRRLFGATKKTSQGMSE